MFDLFGQPVVDSDFPGGRRKGRLGAHGYAARPGSGPKGETCRSCQFACRVQGGRRYFWKCEKNKRNWTHGLASDIRLKSPACFFWQMRVLNLFRKGLWL